MTAIVIMTGFGQFIVARPGMLHVRPLFAIMLGTISHKGEIDDAPFEQRIYYTSSIATTNVA